MGIGKMLGAGAAVLAVVAMATPAEAQRHRGRHHRGDRIDGGDVLLGAILAGGLIAITSSANRRERERREAEERAAADAAYAESYERREATTQQPAYAPAYADVTDADSAADACAAAAESTGLRFAKIARVGSIAQIDPSGPNWFVRGTIELRNDYRARWDARSFQCNIAGAGAPTVRIDGYAQ